MRVLLTPLIAAALAGILSAGAWAQETSEDEAIAAYLQEHPEAVVNAIRSLAGPYGSFEDAVQRVVLRERMQALREGPSLGDADGPVLIEFFDYNCGYCRRNAAATVDFARQHGFRLIFKEYPIFGQRTPGSDEAARAALAAERQGAYVDFHLALMDTEGTADEDRALIIAEDLGLDVEQLQRDMADPAIAATLEANLRLGMEARLTGTPAYIVGDRAVTGWRPERILQLTRLSD